jgi:glyoxylase I family protein
LYIIELFSFPNPPMRQTQPEAMGLRHLAFQVSDIEGTVEQLYAKDIITEPIRVDEYTNKKFSFLRFKLKRL